MTTPPEEGKRRAGEAGAELVEDGMVVGLGTGSTVAHFITALAGRGLRLRCVATSRASFDQATGLGLAVEPFRRIERLDLAVDGADQVTPDRWLVKGGGGAHTREKVVAASADRFVVIVSADKLVEEISAPVPLELMDFGLEATLARLGTARVRDGWPPSPDAGVIADWTGPVGDPAALAVQLDAVPGVVAHGLFPPALVSQIIVG